MSAFEGTGSTVARRDFELRCPVMRLGAAALAWAAVAGGVRPTAAAEAGARQSPKELPASVDERVQLYAAAAGYGALSGYWVHELSGGEGWATWVLPGVAVGATGVAAVAWLDHEDRLRWGQPQALVTDASIGTGIAALWVWHDRARRPASEGWSPALQGTLLWSGATAGALLGALRYELSPSPPGQATFTGSVALWSGALAGLVGGALTPDDGAREANASLAAALGTEGGVILGAWLGRVLRPEAGWSVGWVRALDAGALLGAVAIGGGTAWATGDGVTARTTLAAAAGGAVLGGAAAITLAPRLGLPRGSAWTLSPEIAPERVVLRLGGRY